MTFPSRHVSVSIERPPAEVYEYASNHANLPEWAAGLSSSIANVEGEWVAESPMGRVKVRFAERNTLGVLDHDVTLPSGESVSNAMRVVPNDRGSEVLFTVYQRPGASDEAFLEDARAVEVDLQRLKRILEA